MYLGVDAEGNHLYEDLAAHKLWGYAHETHLPPRTVKLKNNLFYEEHRSSLKIGYAGTNYEKHDYIVTNAGRLFRYFGMEGDKFSYRNMSGRGVDGTYREVLSDYKIENKAIQFTL